MCCWALLMTILVSCGAASSSLHSDPYCDALISGSRCDCGSSICNGTTQHCRCAPIDWPQRGLTFTAGKYCPFVRFDSPLSDLSLTALSSTGANFVAIVVTTFQHWPNSTTFLPHHPLTDSEQALAHAITKAHRLGMRVMLKPHVDMSCALGPDQTLPSVNASLSCGIYGSSSAACGTWRGCIGQSNGAYQAFDDQRWDAWFASYLRMVVKYATLAQRMQVSQLCIGTELQGASSQARHWRRIARAVREVYSGRLTYAANWGGDETDITWWDALDLIGIDAYYPLPNVNCSEIPVGGPCVPIARPTKQDLVLGWNQIIGGGVKDGPEGEKMKFGLHELSKKFYNLHLNSHIKQLVMTYNKLTIH